MFLHATGDDFIVPENSKVNFDSWGGKIKEFKLFDGDHTSERPDEIISLAV